MNYNYNNPPHEKEENDGDEDELERICRKTLNLPDSFEDEFCNNERDIRLKRAKKNLFNIIKLEDRKKLLSHFISESIDVAIIAASSFLGTGLIKYSTDRIIKEENMSYSSATLFGLGTGLLGYSTCRVIKSIYKSLSSKK